MKYLLDTNVCVNFLRGKNSTNIEGKLKAQVSGDVALCSVVKAELIFGAERSQQQARNLAQLSKFFAGFPSLFFDDQAADVYGKLRARLEASGLSIGPNDLLIASIALSNQVALVTHNAAEFNRVPGLTVEDWEAD